MMNKRAPKTAAQLAAELEANPDFVARREARQKAKAQSAAARRIEEEPILHDLREAGTDVSSVWDLVNTAEPYPAALPILVAHLLRPYSDPVKEGIARALAVPDARFAWPVLVREYRTSAEGLDPHTRLGARSGLAAALAATATDDVMGELIDLASDPRLGDSRLLLLRGIRRSRTPEAAAAIERLAHDKALRAEILSWRKAKPDGR